MTKVVVEVKDLHKEFALPQHKNTSLKQAFVNIGKSQPKIRQKVLDGVSFEINEGDFFGIVGRNGSGKSTLLKILAGVYAPSSGTVNVHGPLTPFIELGVGFNPELSGRDNVFLNGALLGFSRKEMDVMYDEIVEFAELEQFMDKKLKNYSSGMQVRLAFSIAVKAKNDILIFDEVLAVGDEAFQRKCLDIFEQHKANKQTVILVTHDMETVKKFCNRAMLINEGKVVELGDPRAVAEKYSKLNQESIDKDTEKSNDKEAAATYLKAQILSENHKPKQSFKNGDWLLADVKWPGLAPEKIESIGINIFKQSGEHITGINTRFTEHSKNWKANGQIALAFKLDIAPGNYYLLIEAFEVEGKAIDSILHGPKFSIVPSPLKWSGLMELPHEWLEGKSK